MSDFRKSLLWTAIPIVILSIIGMCVTAIRNVAIAPFIVWSLAAFCCVGAIIALIVFALINKRQIAAGILAGLGIGIVALGATCFAGDALRGTISF